MSSTLKWNPATPKEERQGLPVALKFALRQVFGEPVVATFSLADPRSMGILDTLVAMEVQGASELREIVDRHEIVDVWEQY